MSNLEGAASVSVVSYKASKDNVLSVKLHYLILNSSFVSVQVCKYLGNDLEKDLEKDLGKDLGSVERVKTPSNLYAKLKI